MHYALWLSLYVIWDWYFAITIAQSINIIILVLRLCRLGVYVGRWKLMCLPSDYPPTRMLLLLARYSMFIADNPLVKLRSVPDNLHHFGKPFELLCRSYTTCHWNVIWIVNSYQWYYIGGIDLTCGVITSPPNKFG